MHRELVTNKKPLDLRPLNHARAFNVGHYFKKWDMEPAGLIGEEGKCASSIKPQVPTSLEGCHECSVLKLHVLVTVWIHPVLENSASNLPARKKRP